MHLSGKASRLRLRETPMPRLNPRLPKVSAGASRAADQGSRHRLFDRTEFSVNTSRADLVSARLRTGVRPRAGPARGSSSPSL